MPVLLRIYTRSSKYTDDGDVDNDGGEDNDLNTSADNKTASVSFNYIVTEVNNQPTLDSLSDVNVSEDAAEQTVNLAGITAGPEESQNLRVTALSSDPSLLLNPTVTYSSADPTGTIKFTPVADQSGTATVTVTVEDAGLDSDFNTTADNASFSQSFVVTVAAVNDTPGADVVADLAVNEDAGEQNCS